MNFISGIHDANTLELLIAFDTYFENSYHNSNPVAYEPLERNTFSSDSKQSTPFTLSVNAGFSITGDASSGDTVDVIRDKLDKLAKDATLVNVSLYPLGLRSTQDSQYYQYASVYTNLALVSIDYQNNPDQLEFRPNLVFQEIRITDTAYTASQNTANPEDSATSNAGQVQPQADTSFLFDAFGKVGLPL
jgi:hypothetical protein